MASQLTVATICLLLGDEMTQIQAPMGPLAGLGAVGTAEIASAASRVVAAGASLAGTTIRMNVLLRCVNAYAIGLV
ncbi:hypothetical protein DPMN_178843 [Dreissena polymorpha]|uniref:Uncharacterized protein n=1 Tax=Dreissena polymorpha TaxID=45954 RepID=A0A9D4EF12_DREPO|nr:hypothetical protein DPMN_178843 [Dreissena polymorpha]